MTNYRKIKVKCPSCGAMYKVIERCSACGKLCCVICSINNICIDCFTRINAQDEVMSYNFDKEKEIMT